MAQREKQRTVTLPITAQQSLMAVKNSIRIALSSVCYFRNLFPDKIFKPKEYCGLELMIFHPDVKKSSACHENAYNLIHTFEKGVFDALEKKYLERLLLNIHASDPTEDLNAEVLESYSFKFAYDSDSNFVNGQRIGKSRNEVQNATRSLLKKMVTLTSGLEVLPERTWISVNLIYNSSTPATYEPPCFEPVAKGSLPDFRVAPLSIDLGETNTGFDRVIIKLRIPDKEGKTQDPEATIDENIVQPDNRRPQVFEDRFKHMKLSSPKSKWTQDTITADQENIDPGIKASRGKRKILCELANGGQNKKSRKRERYKKACGVQIF